MPTARKRATVPATESPTDTVATETDREGLLTALGKLKPALRTGGSIPGLDHIWFVGGHIHAYDSGLGIRLPQDLGVTCGVPGRPLLGVLGTSSLKEVGISHAEKEVALVVKLGRSKTKLNVLDPSGDPWPFPAEHAGKSHLSAEGVEAIRAVLVSKSSEQRLEHHGIAIYSDGAFIDIYATDSKTISQASYTDGKAKLPKFVFLPRPLAEQIVALCPHGVDLTVAEDHFAAVSPGVEICSHVLDTTGLRDMPEVVDKNIKSHPEKPVPLPTGLEAALDRAEILAGSEEAIVELTVSKKVFRLAGKFPYGELNEELTLEEAHPDAKIKVDAAILRRGLLASDSFSLTDMSLALFGGNNFMYMVAARS